MTGPQAGQREAAKAWWAWLQREWMPTWGTRPLRQMHPDIQREEPLSLPKLSSRERWHAGGLAEALLILSPPAPPPSRQEAGGMALPRVLGLWCPLQREGADSLFFPLCLPEAGHPHRGSPRSFYAGPRQAVGLVLGKETCAGRVPELSFSVILPKMGCCFRVREQLWGHPQPWPSLSTRGAGLLHGASFYRSQQAPPTGPQTLVRVYQPSFTRRKLRQGAGTPWVDLGTGS